MTTLRNEPMKNHTTFKIGGAADAVLFPDNIDEFCDIVAKSKKFLVIGNGSNLLVSDEGFRGDIVKVTNLTGISINDTIITVDCGVSLGRLAAFAYEHELSGLEFAAGIPGTVGGAVFMNAGAYGGEIGDLVREVLCLRNGKIERVTNPSFAYRHSSFMENGDIILQVVLELSQGNRDDIKNTMRDYAAKRASKQPIDMPSAGSVFKRPEGYFAGKLIEDSGLKGFSIGGAQVSEKHCGFIINTGNAKACDVLDLIEHIKTTVYTKFGVNLEEEIKCVL